MIVIYTSEGCSSCRKAKQYMKDNHLKFVEKNINKETLKEDEVRYLLKRTENGTQDLISSRSRIIKESEVDIEDMSTSDLVRFIADHPTILKRPIIVDGYDMQTGYDEEQISIFKKNDLRKVSLAI